MTYDWMALATMAGCISFSQLLFNLFGLVRIWSWTDLSWSWAVAALMSASWWIGPQNPWVAVGILAYIGFTAMRTYVLVWSRREAAKEEAESGS